MVDKAENSDILRKAHKSVRGVEYTPNGETIDYAGTERVHDNQPTGATVVVKSDYKPF